MHFIPKVEREQKREKEREIRQKKAQKFCLSKAKKNDELLETEGRSFNSVSFSTLIIMELFRAKAAKELKDRIFGSSECKKTEMKD